jgi:hypothetical protein
MSRQRAAFPVGSALNLTTATSAWHIWRAPKSAARQQPRHCAPGFNNLSDMAIRALLLNARCAHGMQVTGRKSLTIRTVYSPRGKRMAACRLAG